MIYSTPPSTDTAARPTFVGNTKFMMRGSYDMKLPRYYNTEAAAYYMTLIYPFIV